MDSLIAAKLLDLQRMGKELKSLGKQEKDSSESFKYY